MPVSPQNQLLDDTILVTLEDGELETPTLAQKLGEDLPRIYRRCRYLEGKQLVESELISGSRQLFCVDHRVILTRANYGSHRGHDIRSINPEVRLWGLPPGGRPSA